MVSLTKGQKVSLEKSSGGALTRVTMGVGWDVRKAKGLFGAFKSGDIDLDASCILFDANRRPVDVVWFRQLRSKDGALIHTGDNLTGAGDGDDEQIKVDLASVAPAVTSIVFTVSSFRGDTFDKIENAFCRLVDDATNQEIARFDLSDSGSHTGIIMAKVVRDGAGWTMTALGEKVHSRSVEDIGGAAAALI